VWWRPRGLRLARGPKGLPGSADGVRPRGACGKGALPLLFGVSIETLIAGVPGLLAAIVFHEWAHAAVSTALGDPTPARYGRLSLNPLAHIDWIGMIMLWLFRFGWARPVQIDPRYYRNPRSGLLMVALAGPAMNVLLGFVFLWLFLHLSWGSSNLGHILQQMVYLAVLYNVFFAVFNILPIPPLDGSRVVAALSEPGARLMAQIEPYGWIVLLLLVFTGVLTNTVLLPMATWLTGVLQAAAAL
jgi:Zn-dependent protease